MEKEINTYVNKFFDKFQFPIDSIEVIKQKEDIYLIKIKSLESKLLIWTHWKNLRDIEYIIKILISKNISEKIKIHLEINDYIYNKDLQLFSYIDEKIKQVNDTWKDYKLGFLSAYERKKVHSYIADLKNKNIFTKSIWEGNQRRLYICKKSDNITIDLDWNDI